MPDIKTETNPPLADGGSIPWVSIVIPIHSCRATIGKTLDGLGEQKVPAPCEIIFLRDIIKDDTLEIIHAHPLAARWDMVEIDRPGGGLAAAYNLGWRAARSRYILLMHPDCYPVDKDALQRQVDWLEKENALAVEPLIDIPQGDWDTMSFWDRVTSSQFRHAKPAHGLAGKFDLYRREALEKLGGFDDVHFFSAAEDADMVLRLMMVGTIAYSDVVVVHAHIHPPASRFTSTLRKQAQVGEGAGALLRKHGFAWAFAPSAFPITVVNGLKLSLLVGAFVPVFHIWLVSIALMLLLASYYGRWAFQTRDWRVPLIPFAVSLMFSVYAIYMVRGFVLGRQSFHYAKRVKN
jgi:cellulose synthase/poly-beta-1,6-N-acetylglucosamine synthase-like glycosyltransferase